MSSAAPLSKPGEDIPAPVKTAATLMTIWGPCRFRGDAYLACVALKGKGECQSLRHMFEGCMQTHVAESLTGLEDLAGMVGGVEAAATMVLSRHTAAKR